MKGKHTRIQEIDIIHSQSFLKVNRYELIRIIGVGEFGATIEAKHIDRNEQVAIKLLLVEEGANLSLIEKSCFATQIKSPYLIKITAQFYDESRYIYYIVSEYCSGGNLCNLTEREVCLSSSAIINIFSDILRGIIQIHQHNFIHGNLKPENIVFNCERKPLLTDFGFHSLQP